MMLNPTTNCYFPKTPLFNSLLTTRVAMTIPESPISPLYIPGTLKITKKISTIPPAKIAIINQTKNTLIHLILVSLKYIKYLPWCF